MYKKYFILFLIFCYHVFAETNYCENINSNQTIFLKPETLGFFKSENYPTFVKSSCNIIFALKDYNTLQKYRFTLIFDTAYYDPNTIIGLLLNWHYYIAYENNSLTNFIAPALDLKKDAAVVFKGFGLFEYFNSNYPLEFTKDKPFYFENEDQIIYIFTRYDEGQLNRTYPCIWKFMASSNYGFKIVFTYSMILFTEAQLIVENTTQVIINTRSQKTNHPFYNSDSFIQISLFPGKKLVSTNLYNVSDPELEGYVSIVAKFKIKWDKCLVKSDGKNIIWSNYKNDYALYENDLHCRYSLEIPPNSEVYVTALNSLEAGVDNIFINDEEKNRYPLPQHILEYDYFVSRFMVFSKNISSGSTVLFEFISDGSLQWGGFSLNFTTIQCNCGNPIIPCDGETHFVMKETPFLCGRLHCNFTIQSCATDYISISFYFENFYNKDDMFRIISNNSIVYQFHVALNLSTYYGINENKPYFNTILRSKNVNIFEVATLQSDLARTLSISAQPFSLPMGNSVELPHNFTNHIIDMQEFNLTHVKIQKFDRAKNMKYIVFCNFFDNIQIYDTYNITKNLDYKNGYEIDYANITIEVDVFTIIHTNFSIYPVFLILFQKSPKGCVFKTNVFVYIYNNELNDGFRQTFSALANAEGECPVYFLLKNCGRGSTICILANYWTTASTENVKVYIGNDQTNLFFEFNSATSNDLQRIPLLSGIYTFVIPKKSALLFSIDSDDDPLHNQKRSLFATSFFGTFVSNIDYAFNDECYFSAKFTTIYYNIFQGDEISFSACNRTSHCFKQYVNSVGEVFYFHDVMLQINYIAKKRNKNSGVMFYLESLGFCDCSTSFYEDWCLI